MGSAGFLWEGGGGGLKTFKDFRIQSPERVSDLPKVTHRRGQH